jgi:hypothetical protein
MGRSSRACGKGATTPRQLSQASAHVKAHGKAAQRSRQRNNLLWHRPANGRAFAVFWLCVLSTWLGGLIFAYRYI